MCLINNFYNVSQVVDMADFNTISMEAYAHVNNCLFDHGISWTNGMRCMSFFILIIMIKLISYLQTNTDSKLHMA